MRSQLNYTGRWSQTVNVANSQCQWSQTSTYSISVPLYNIPAVEDPLGLNTLTCEQLLSWVHEIQISSVTLWLQMAHHRMIVLYN